MRDERTPKDVCGEAKDNYEDKILTILTSAHAQTSVILADIHRRKMSDWSTRDHVTLPNSKWRQYLHRL